MCHMYIMETLSGTCDQYLIIHLTFLQPLFPSHQNVNANPRPTPQDLAGFWDLLQLSIEDISMKFDELYQLKANNWQLPEKPEKKVMLGSKQCLHASLVKTN